MTIGAFSWLFEEVSYFSRPFPWRLFLLTNYVVTAVALCLAGEGGEDALGILFCFSIYLQPHLWLGFQGPGAHGPFQNSVIHSFTLILIFPPDKDIYLMCVCPSLPSLSYILW